MNNRINKNKKPRGRRVARPQNNKTKKPKTGRSGPPSHPVEKFKYTDIITMSAIANGAYGTYVFRANSIFDPDKTGTGTLPYDYTPKALEYNRYLVTSVSYDFEMNLSGSMHVTHAVLNGTVSASTLSGFLNIAEQPYGKTAMSNYNSGNPALRLRGGTKLSNLASFPSKYHTDDSYAATFGTNPTEIIDICLCIYNASGSSQTPTFIARLLYNTRLFDRLVQASDFDVGMFATRIADISALVEHRALVRESRDLLPPVPYLGMVTLQVANKS